ncbi:MAG: hypothetical protein MI747_00125 [Desulfobacterales bacterium]|nr:hypothetical protein [Desulfobacterales bacterium]
MKLSKKLLIFIPIVCGLVLFGIMKNSRKAPERLENRERVRTVRVMDLERQPLRPRVVGYGYVAPDRTWEAIAEVGGKVVHMAENLKKGHFLKKGDLLFRIDTEAYGLAETRDRADVRNLDAQLRELAQTRENTRRLLAIEQRSLAISAQEVERKRGLFDKGIISASALEQEERRYLSQKTVVNNLENTLKLLPAREKALQARKSAGLSTVKTRQLDIEKTEFRAPFNGRLSQVDIELGQFAPAGTLLLTAQSIELAEVAIPLTPQKLMSLMPRGNAVADPLNFMGELDQFLGIEARVQLPLSPEKSVVWTGRFSRISDALDARTGTITVYVTVDRPYGEMVPGTRPPLVSGMYVAVEFLGRPLADQWVVPVTALHVEDGREHWIYLCSPENRLVRRAVLPGMRAGELVSIRPRDQWEAGNRLILSDIMPAVDGMKLHPVDDPDMAHMVKIQARGEDSHGK